MRHPRMLGIRGEQRLEQRRRLERPRKGLVVEVMVGADHQRGEDFRFDIVGIRGGELLHRLLIGEGTLPVRHRGMVFVERRKRRDVVALARRGGTDVLRFLDRLSPFFQLQRDRPAEGVIGRHHGQAPMRHATARIEASNLVERRFAPRPIEGVVQRHGAVEFGLCGVRTGHCEVHVAKPAGPGGALVRPGTEPRPKAQAQDDDSDGQRLRYALHGWSLPVQVRFFVQLPRRLSRIYYTPSEHPDLAQILPVR